MDPVLCRRSLAANLTDGAIERFEALLKIAIRLKLERTKFYDCCKDWCYATEQASIYIKQVETKLVDVNRTTNCVTLGGTSTAIVGTAMGIAGVVLALPTAGASLLLTAGGTSAAAIGGGLSLGSHITKHCLSKSFCEKAKKALDETIHLTERLEEQRIAYFDTLFEFQNCLEKLTEIELQTARFQLDEWSSLTELQFDDKTKSCLHPTVNRMMMIKPQITPSLEEKLMMIIREVINAISEDPLAKRLLGLVQQKVQKLLPSVDFSSAFGSTEKRARILLQGSVAAWKLVQDTKLTIKTTLKSMSKTVRVGIGVLNVLFLAWGIFDLVTTSINVHHDSKSSKSEQLSTIAKELKEYREEVVRLLRDIFDWDFANE